MTCLFGGAVIQANIVNKTDYFIMVRFYYRSSFFPFFKLADTYADDEDVPLYDQVVKIYI